MPVPSPVAARDLKRTPARVTCLFSDGRTVSIPKPSLPAWLAYAKNQGVDTALPHETPIQFWDNGIFITVEMGEKR